jgi:ribokinase
MNSDSAARVIVAGSINMDIVAQVQRLPVPGETVPGTSLAYFPGGKGANQAVAASRAGGDVLMIGAVGDDAFGPDLLGFLRSNRIDTDVIEKRDGTPTGTALITVDDSGENSIVVVPGANGSLIEDYVVGAVIPQKGDVLVAQFETPLLATIAFFAAGKAAGATCILNPAPAGNVPTDLLSHVDILVVNETELGIVSGGPIGDSPSVGDIKAANERLRTMGFTGSVVVTLGARGAVTILQDRIIEVFGRAVTAVDTTGAGDCFVGYLASSLALGRDMDKALVIANAAASLCVQRRGAGPSMPERIEVDELLSAAT